MTSKVKNSGVSNVIKLIKKALNHHFGYPVLMNWGYPVMYMSVGLALIFCIKLVIARLNPDFSTTSVVGQAILMPLLVLIALIFPGASMCERSRINANGKFTGIGPLFTAFLSGAPTLLIYYAFHNISSWMSLTLFEKMLFPSFYFAKPEGFGINGILAFIAGNAIPALGVCFFFFGLIWSRFRKSNKNIAALIVCALLVLFSVNPVDSASILVIALWCCFLRDRAGNIWAPFSCMMGAFLTSFFVQDFVSMVDITSVQSASDINITYFYSSFPALLISAILLFFFMRLLNDFYISYNDSLFITKEEQATYEETESKIPELATGFNAPFVFGLIIIVVIWILTILGVQL